MLWICFFFLAVEDAHAHTIFECWTRVLQYSPEIRQKESEIAQTDARTLGSVAPFLPLINASFLYLRQEEIQNPLGAQFFPAEQSTSKITLNQNLFRGFRDYQLWRTRRLEQEASRLEKEWKQVEVKLEVTDSFYELLRIQTDLDLVELQMHAQQERLEDSIIRKKSGQYRETDRLNIETQLVQLEAQKESLELQTLLVQKQFRSLLGIDEDWKLEPMSLAVDSLEEEFLGRDQERDGVPTEQRMDQRAKLLRVAASERQVAFASSQHFPSLDLTANYYFQRPGLYQDVRWDVQLGIQLPLFSGFGVLASVTEAKAAALVQSLRQEADVVRAKDTLQGVRDRLQSDIQRYRIWSKASELAEKSWQAYRAEYRRGTTDSLEVMRSLAAYFEARRSKEKVYLDVQQGWIRFQLHRGKNVGEGKA